MNNGMPELPVWLISPENNYKPKRGRVHFLRKTISGITSVFQTEFLAEKYSDSFGLLQSIDPRVKIITVLFFIIFSSAISNIVVKVMIAFTAILYACLSKIKMIDVLRRVWCYFPLLLFLLSIPAALNVFTFGKPLLYLYKNELYLTSGGLIAAARAALTCGVSLSLGYLLFTTTRMAQIEKALRAMKLPEMFVSVLAVAYRYIFVLAKEANKVIEARFLRTVGKTNAKGERSFASHSIASVFIKSQKLSNDVFDAMSCRGYTGKPVSLEKLKIHLVDYIFIACNVIIVLILLLGVYAFG
ncbi:MAG TPA: cobalt ECF transporter T component CbiQ [Ruminiclostridium sp.]|nr:cobalt ECF transporter T component CbiQ [Ruminiclostridium sp.]